jgi:hypothetical protein
MPDNSASIVSKVWNYAHVLKNAGVGYGDYVEVRAARAFITYLLFLKLAPSSQCYAGTGDEMTELGFDPPSLRYGRARNPIPAEFQWSELSSTVAAASRRSFPVQNQRRDASATLHQVHYRHTLGKEPCHVQFEPCC